jgi:hypothetical protein
MEDWTMRIPPQKLQVIVMHHFLKMLLHKYIFLGNKMLLHIETVNITLLWLCIQTGADIILFSAELHSWQQTNTKKMLTTNLIISCSSL